MLNKLFSYAGFEDFVGNIFLRAQIGPARPMTYFILPLDSIDRSINRIRVDAGKGENVRILMRILIRLFITIVKNVLFVKIHSFD